MTSQPKAFIRHMNLLLISQSQTEKKNLDKLESPVHCNAPGILTDMIDTVSNSDLEQIQTYKFCVDDRNINSGTRGQKLGDISWWGFEDSPTLVERETRLQHDLTMVKELHISKGVLRVVPESSRDTIYQKIIGGMNVSQDRIQDLRMTEVGKKIGLNKLLNQVS